MGNNLETIIYNELLKKMEMCSLETANLEDIISRGKNFKWAWRAQ